MDGGVQYCTCTIARVSFLVLFSTLAYPLFHCKSVGAAAANPCSGISQRRQRFKSLCEAASGKVYPSTYCASTAAAAQKHRDALSEKNDTKLRFLLSFTVQLE